MEQLSNVLAAEHPEWRVYRVDPGDMNTRLHQEAFPDEDVSDRPDPSDSVPGWLALITGDLPSGRYQARSVVPVDDPAWTTAVDFEVPAHLEATGPPEHARRGPGRGADDGRVAVVRAGPRQGVP